MWFSRKQGADEPTALGQTQGTTKSRGDAAEAAALAWLKQGGLVFEGANYRTPGRGGGEIDLIMRDKDGTLVFVEVRQRSGSAHGGAAASIGSIKQRRIIFAAQHYLLRFGRPPPCRFDVVLVNGTLTTGAAAPAKALTIEWLKAAFDAS